ASGPRPPGVIHVVGLRPAKRLHAAEAFQRTELLLNRIRYVVLREQLTDRANLSLGAWTVVAKYIENDRVIANPEWIQLVDDLAGLGIDVFGEPGEKLHQPQLKVALGLGDAIPGRHTAGTCGVRRVGGNTPQFLLLLVDGLTKFIPAAVELSFIFVGPFLEDVMRCVSCARGPIHKERLVRRPGRV